MMLVLETFAGVMAILVLIPVMILAMQVGLACLRQRVDAQPVECRPTVGVVIPAHNESEVILRTLAALLPQMRAGDRVLVVADNCTDDTALLSRQAGAEVVERQSATQRGKGFALDFGVRHFEGKPPEVLVVVDADCIVEGNAMDQLALRCAATGRPVQALYLMGAPSGGGTRARIAAFAWLVKNHVRPLGWHQIGWPCQLMGTGMAFPWPLAAKMHLANANIVEDMKLGIDLAVDGYPPLFCPGATVSSEFPLAQSAVKTQRTRWEHGHLSMILRECPGLIWAGVLRRDFRLIAMAMDLAVPPLALLGLMVVLSAMLGIVSATVGVTEWPLYLAVGGGVLFGIVILGAWLGWGRRVVAMGELLAVPLYVMAKLPLYLKFWGKRQKEWVRTERK